MNGCKPEQRLNFSSRTALKQQKHFDMSLMFFDAITYQTFRPVILYFVLPTIQYPNVSFGAFNLSPPSRSSGLGQGDAPGSVVSNK